MDTIWVYVEDKRKFLEVSKEDPRLDWSAAAYAPPKRVRFRSTKVSKQWRYTPYGATKEECADAANMYVNEEIVRFEVQLADLRSRLVKP